jgi:hypothetical protein
MENQEKGPVKKAPKQNSKKQRKGIIAVAAVFVVACAFSYLAGMQQQTGRFSPTFASTFSNGVQNIQSGAQTTANTSGQPTQDNANYAADNNLAQNGIQADTANQGINGYSGNMQGSFGGGYGGHGGGRGRHGGGFGAGGYNTGAIAQNGGTGAYSANVQRCCATGKTGTCHS